MPEDSSSQNASRPCAPGNRQEAPMIAIDPSLMIAGGKLDAVARTVGDGRRRGPFSLHTPGTKGQL